MDDFFRAAVSFFAIIDPIGNILVFALITQRSGREERWGVAVGLAFGLVVLFTLTGNSVLDFLDISAESFRIAAGVLLVFPALRLVEHGNQVATTGEGLPGGGRCKQPWCRWRSHCWPGRARWRRRRRSRAATGKGPRWPRRGRCWG